MARDLVDTEDVVHETFRRALNNLDRFVPRREGAFFSYLCRGVVNQIRDQVRRVTQQGVHTDLPEEFADERLSALDLLIWDELLGAYEAAFEQLTEKQREAFTMRIELGLTYREIAETLGSPSPDAVRGHVARALVRLAQLMRARHGPRRDVS